MSTVTVGGFSWKRIFVAVFVPALLYSSGTGAIVPLIPLVADHLGSSLAVAGFVGALYSVGMLAATLPAASLVQALGERWAMAAAAGFAAIGSIVSVLATQTWMLAIGVAMIGGSTAVFGIARSAYMTTNVPLTIRARAMSSLSGTFRLGEFLGPFIAAGAITVLGGTQLAFWVHVTGCSLVILLLLFVKDPEGSAPPAISRRARAAALAEGPDAVPAAPREGVFTIMRKRRSVLIRLGIGSMLLIGMRSGRFILIPLLAVSLGMTSAETALLVGMGGAIEFAVFYAGGQVMDRFGRIWVAVPTMIGVGIGFLGIAATHEFDSAVGWLIALVAVVALFNGMASGVSMTMGSDLADRRNPAPFLAVWRFTNDIGAAAMPLLVAATAAVSVVLASASMGVLAFVGAAMFARYIPRLLPDTRRGRETDGESR